MSHPDRLNILYLHSHDTGRHIQPYGHAVQTPHLQRLAGQSVLFRNAFCAAPTCSPSRAALLSGQWAHQAGMLGLAHRGWRMRDYGRHLVRYLKAWGYGTALCGVQHEGTPEQIGYDAVLSAGHSETGRAAANFLRGHPQEPFFLSVGMFQTHRAFPQPSGDAPDTDPRYVAAPPGLPDTPRTRRDMAAFNTMARRLDEQYGQVLAALEESGLSENTIVLCTTDHGIAFPHAKCNLTDAGIGVLLMLRAPERMGFVAGSVCDAMVSQVDIFPTLCELLKLPRPDWLVGQSLGPLLRGQAVEVRDELFAEVTYHAAYEPQRCVRTARYKLIRRYGEPAQPALPNIDAGDSKDQALECGLGEAALPRVALFDLWADPWERVNLADDPAHAAMRRDLEQRLEAWMVRTDDPLLTGPVLLPPGAVVNPRTQRDPDEPVFRNSGPDPIPSP